MAHFLESKTGQGMVFAGIAVAGLAAYFLTANLLSQARKEIKDASQQMSALSNKEYLPSEQNITVLDANIHALQNLLDPVVAQSLEPSAARMAKINEENPQRWKSSELDPAIQKLLELAKSRGVALRPDFYFGFNRYAKQPPVAEAIKVLNRQLYGIEKLGSFLLEASPAGEITRLDAVRRTYDEDGAGSNEGSGLNRIEGDMLGGGIISGGRGLYRSYPFELEFTGATAGLRHFLNALIKSPDLFIVRSIQVTNSKPDSPRQPQPESLKGPDIVLGNDTLQIKIWVDLIEWTGGTPVAAAQPAPETGPEN